MKRIFMITDGPLLLDVCIGKEAQTLVRAGYDVTVAADGQQTKIMYGKNPAEYKGVRLKYIKTKSFKSFVMPDINRFLSLLKECKPDIISVQNSLFTPYGLLASKLACSPLIVYLHDVSFLLISALPYNKVLRAFASLYHYASELLPIRAANVIITNTEEMKLAISKIYKIPSEKINVVLNTPPTRDFVRVHPSRDAQLRNRFVILYAGAIDPFRNLAKVVKSLKYIDSRARAKTLLVIVGGSLPCYKWCVQELHNLINSEKLADKVYLTGKLTRSETLSYIASSDVCILAHEVNSYTNLVSPTKVHEYAALGKPIISTPLKPVLRLYGDAITVWDGNSTQTLGNILSMLFFDEQLRKKLGLKAKNLFWNEYSWDIEAIKFIKIYKKYCGE